MAKRNTSTERLVTGVKELDRKLKELPQAPANRAARAGLLKGAWKAATLIKKQIPSKFKGIRAAIGASVKKAKQGVTTAKAGAAVGKKAKGLKKPPKRSSKGGVGIGANNIHWWLMGTSERVRKSFDKKGAEGKSPFRNIKNPTAAQLKTGKMPQFPAVKKAMSGGTAPVMSAIQEGASKQLAKELAKLARKK